MRRLFPLISSLAFLALWLLLGPGELHFIPPASEGDQARIQMWQPGSMVYAFAENEGNVPSQEKAAGLSLEITSSVSGRVTDQGGYPVPGVDVFACAWDGCSLTGCMPPSVSGDGGLYIITDLIECTYQITTPLIVSSSPLVTVPPDATGVDLVVMGHASSIRGRITDELDNPIPGVTVSTGLGQVGTTGIDGNYIIGNLTLGNYTITPSKGGYTFSPALRTVNVPPDATGLDFVGRKTSEYDRTPIVFVHGWNGLPPWAPCQWPDPDAYFSQVDDYLAASYYVEYARLETSPCYTPPIVDNVPRLRNAIAQAKAATGRDKVILIAHSMGGLVSRAYVEGPGYAGDVEALFTFGSPHQGVPADALVFFANGLSLGEYCAHYQPAACDFSVRGMEFFNRDHSRRTSGVAYHVISGDAPFSPRTASAMAAYVALPGGDDGAVQTGSGIGLSGLLDRWVTDEVHGAGSGPRSYFIRDGDQSTSYTQCLRPVLVDRTTNACGSFGVLDSSTVMASMALERTSFEFGTLLSGETTTRTVSLEGGPTLFASQWQTEALEFTLVDPGDQVIDPAYAAGRPDLVTYEADATHAIYDFPDAVAGTWNMVLRATSALAEGSAYTMFAAFDSALQFTADIDRDWYPPGSAATITAALSDSSASAAITATVLYADGISQTLSLSPQGAGWYQGSHVVRDAPGYAEVRLAAVGLTGDGVPYERGVGLVFQISPDSAALGGEYSDVPEPRSPGSPYYEALVVRIGIDSAIGGTVGLSADLQDAEDNYVAHSLTITDVIPGTGTLQLRFDGDEICASEKNGPYTLTNLLLTDRRGSTLVILEAEDVYTSGYYDYRSFGRAKVYLPVVLRRSP